MRLRTLILLLIAVSGCHTMRFEISSEPHTHVVYQRKSFFLFELVPTREVDVSAICPDGVASIREETRFSDGLLRLVTLGIWTPRSSWYYCLGGGKQP